MSDAPGMMEMPAATAGSQAVARIARLNARAVRTALSREAWTAINRDSGC